MDRRLLIFTIMAKSSGNNAKKMFQFRKVKCVGVSKTNPKNSNTMTCIAKTLVMSCFFIYTQPLQTIYKPFYTKLLTNNHLLLL